MAWRIVKQPNGRLARFSDVVDNFTDVDMSEEEAIRLCHDEHGMSAAEANKKVKAGVDDLTPWTMTPGSGQDRWDDCLKTIRRVHGARAVTKLLKEMA